jgi:DNA-binding transcriptional ArsR family regulator
MNDMMPLSDILQVLSDANRLNIIAFIGTGEYSVSQIIGHVALSQPLVSHHLRALRENRILETNRKGPFVYYKLTNVKLLEFLGLLEEILLVNQAGYYQPFFFKKKHR